MTASWRLKLFGTVGLVSRDKAYTSFETKRAAKLLVLLGLSRTGTLRRDDLADLLWPDDFLDSTRLRLRQELSRLRRGMYEAADLVTSSNEEVSINRSDVENDLDLLKHPERLDYSELRAMLDADFLPGWDDAWVMAEKTRADQLLVRAATIWANKLLEEHKPQEALDSARAAIKIDPNLEDACQLAMKAHAALGSLSDAVIEFRRFKRQTGSSASEPDFTPPPIAIPAPSEAVVELPQPPHPIDRFFGRATLLQQLSDLANATDSPRLLTIVGPGGMGKTRLALEALKQITIPSGFVSFVECATDEDPAAFLFDQIVRGSQTEDPYIALQTFLNGRRCLLVLDNLEHLHDPWAFMSKLLASAPDLRVWVTSRRPMKVAGEKLLNLTPLDTSEAAFPMLAELTGIDDASRRKDLRRVAELCAGMPLMIRLAAARLRLLEPSEFLEEMRETTKSLRANLPDLAERHRDLDRMLDLTVQSLPDSDVAHLMSLSLFPSGVTRALAKSWMGTEVDQILERLLDTSLIWLDDEQSPMRFRMLEPVRQFFKERATDQQRSVAHETFVSTLVKFTEGFSIPYGLTPDSERRSYLREGANLRAALDACIDRDQAVAHLFFARMWHFELELGRRFELTAAIARLRKLSDVPARARGQMLLCETFLTAHQGDMDGAAEKALQARAAFEESGDRDFQTYAQLAHDENIRHRSNWDEVLARYAHIEAEAAKYAPPFVATIRAWRGTVRTYRGEWREAESDLRHAYDATRESGNLSMLVTSGVALLTVAHVRGDTEERKRLMEEVRVAVRELDDPYQWSVHQRAEARFALVDGDYAGAEAHARLGLNKFAFASNTLHEAELNISLARALIGLDRLEEAQNAIQKTAPAVRAGLRRVGLVAGACLAELRQRQGRTEEAANAIATALAYRAAQSVSAIQMEAEYVDAIAGQLGAEPLGSDITDDQMADLLSGRLPA